MSLMLMLDVLVGYLENLCLFSIISTFFLSSVSIFDFLR